MRVVYRSAPRDFPFIKVARSLESLRVWVNAWWFANFSGCFTEAWHPGWAFPLINLTPDHGWAFPQIQSDSGSRLSFPPNSIWLRITAGLSPKFNLTPDHGLVRCCRVVQSSSDEDPYSLTHSGSSGYSGNHPANYPADTGNYLAFMSLLELIGV